MVSIDDDGAAAMESWMDEEDSQTLSSLLKNRCPLFDEVMKARHRTNKINCDVATTMQLNILVDFIVFERLTDVCYI